VLVSVKASLQFYRMNLTPACNFLTWSQKANVSARGNFRCTNNGTVLLSSKYKRTHFNILMFFVDNAVNVVDTDFMEYYGPSIMYTENFQLMLPKLV